MSQLIVAVTTIGEVRPHPNADRLDLTIVEQHQTVIPKGQHTTGERVIYVPPGACVPPELAESLGVATYLGKGGRVRSARLRGEVSHGFVLPAPPYYLLGQNVAEDYGITKYVPPLKAIQGDMETPHPLFGTYTEIENFRHWPEAFLEGEEVEWTEKIHGCNVKVGSVDGEYMAGSHNHRRKIPVDWQEQEPGGRKSPYWFPLTIPGVKLLIDHLTSMHRKQVILYGEVFGPGIQSLHYGLKNAWGFRAFDLLVDGQYWDAKRFHAICDHFQVMTVPIIGYTITNHLEIARALAEGGTTVNDDDHPPHIREGVVGRPVRERTDPKLGRVILKYVSDAYLIDVAGQEVADI